MKVRAGVLALVVLTGVLSACTPGKLVPNAGVLRQADGKVLVLVVPCDDHAVTDVVLSQDAGAAPATASRQVYWWIEAPQDPARRSGRGVVDTSVEVVAFEAPPGWTVLHNELDPPVRAGVTYSAGGFMQGRYRHQAVGPDFTPTDLDRLRPDEVLASARKRNGTGNGKPIVMSRGDFERRASGAC
jgi:hypothetical protein